MAFHVTYPVGGEIDRVKYVQKIKNFAQLNQPYNKMVGVEVPALVGNYKIEYTSPPVEAELLAIVVTCSGYGEDDYYNVWVNGLLWFDTWYPTEVKEGLYIGTSTYVHVLEPETKFEVEFHNVSGTSKKIWIGVRMLVDEGFDITNPTGEGREAMKLLTPIEGTMPSVLVDNT